MKIKELLAKEENWTKFHYSIEKTPRVTSYCLFGAIGQCYKTEDDIERVSILMYENLPEWANRNLTLFNDDKRTTHKDVLDLVTKLDI